MNETPIYTITTVRAALGAGSRTVGFAHKLPDAIKWVEENALNINEEGYYPYAVIEPIKQGIYNFDHIEYWYKFNREKDSYEQCPKPERFKNVVSWGMG